jgi:uncharacterized Ntn-hydrolase superfamily protein
MTDSNKIFAEFPPFERWEMAPGESAAAFAAFSVYRDFGPERNIRKAVNVAEPDPVIANKRYRVWRVWAAQHSWRERAAAYDQYRDRMKLAGNRRGYEALEDANREVLKKMAAKNDKAMEMLDPARMGPETLRNYVETCARLTREGLALSGGPVKESDQELQPLITFSPEFEGL